MQLRKATAAAAGQAPGFASRPTLLSSYSSLDRNYDPVLLLIDRTYSVSIYSDSVAFNFPKCYSRGGAECNDFAQIDSDPGGKKSTGCQQRYGGLHSILAGARQVPQRSTFANEMGLRDFR